MNIIQTLRQRPLEERRAFALLFSGGIALVLFLVWGVTFFRGTQSTATVVKESAVSSKNDIQDAQRIFVKFVAQISSQYTDLQKGIYQGRSSTSSENNATISGGNTKEETVLGPFRISTSTSHDTQNTLTNILNTEKKSK